MHIQMNTWSLMYILAVQQTLISTAGRLGLAEPFQAMNFPWPGLVCIKNYILMWFMGTVMPVLWYGRMTETAAQSQISMVNFGEGLKQLRRQPGISPLLRASSGDM